MPAAQHAAIASLCFSSGSRYLCTGGADRIVKVWDLKNKSLIRRFTVRAAAALPAPANPPRALTPPRRSTGPRSPPC